MMPNVVQYPVRVAAVLGAGLVGVKVNPPYAAGELGHQLVDSGAEAVIVLANFASTLQQASAGGKHPIRHIVVASMGDLLGFPKGLIGYKRPQIIEFRTDLLKANVSKILRRELRDGALKGARSVHAACSGRALSPQGGDPLSWHCISHRGTVD